MSEHPILVPFSKWNSETASALVCTTCGRTRRATEDEIGVAEPFLACLADDCDGGLDWKYLLADECPGCGKLGFYEKVLGGCCSRVCQLQAEYAKEFAARRAS